MATRLIGTDSANPRLPDVVVAATQGTTHSDLAPGDIGVLAVAEANAYTDEQIAEVVAGGVQFADNAETVAGVLTDQAVTPASLAYSRPHIDARSYGVDPAATATVNATGINNALTAASTANIPVVLLPAGVINIDTAVVMVAGTELRGSRHGTTLKMTGPGRVIRITNTPRVTLRDLTIDCNKTGVADDGTTIQNGIFISSGDATGCPGCLIERVKVINAWDRCIAAAAVAAGTNPLEVTILDCEVSGANGAGIFIQNATASHVERCDVWGNGNWGIHVNGGTNTRLLHNRCHDQVEASTGLRGHGICVNGAIVGVLIDGNACYNNNSATSWGIVVGISAQRFRVVNNYVYNNWGGITIDVATTTPTEFIDTQGVVAGNVTVACTASNGLHVNRADGLQITGNMAAWNAQTGIEIYGRNCVIDGNQCHHNGRRGISFREESPATMGPHLLGVNLVHDNNTTSGGWTDYFSDLLTNGQVVDVRTVDPLPFDVPAGQFVQINPSVTSTTVLTNGVAFALPFDLMDPQAFDQLLFEVVTTPGSAGSVCRGGLYRDDGTGRRPGLLIADLGTVDTSTVGVKTFTIASPMLPAGRFWAEIVPQGAPATNPTIRTITAPRARVAVPGMANLLQQFLATSGITGALASPHPTVNSNNSLSIMMALRAA